MLSFSWHCHILTLKCFSEIKFRNNVMWWASSSVWNFNNTVLLLRLSFYISFWSSHLCQKIWVTVKKFPQIYILRIENLFSRGIFKNLRMTLLFVVWGWRMELSFLVDIAVSINRSSHQRCSVTKGVLRNFAKFTGKHLYKSPLGLQLY